MLLLTLASLARMWFFFLISFQNKIKYHFLHNCFDSSFSAVPVGLKMLSLSASIVPCIFHFHSAYCTHVCICISKFPLAQCFSTFFFQLLPSLEAFWDRFPSLIVPIPLSNYNTTIILHICLYIVCISVFYIKKRIRFFIPRRTNFCPFWGNITLVVNVFHNIIPDSLGIL